MYPSYGGKVGIDATTKWPEEGLNRVWPEIIEPDPTAFLRAEEIWKRIGPEKR